MDRSRESVTPPQSPVEELVHFLHESFDDAIAIQRRYVASSTRSGTASTTQLPQFFHRQVIDNELRHPHDRILRRGVPEVSLHQGAFASRDVESGILSGANYHIVRPLILVETEGISDVYDDEDGFTPVDIEVEIDDGESEFVAHAPDRFVIYVERPHGGADLCYVAHSKVNGDFVLEEFDLEQFGKLGEADETIDLVVEQLLEEIAAEATYGGMDENVQDEVLVESPQDFAERVAMDDFARDLLTQLRDNTTPAAFRDAA